PSRRPPAGGLPGLARATGPPGPGPAWSFGAGDHPLPPRATDQADNAATASTTFTVTVAADDLGALTTQFVHDSAKYSAAGPSQRRPADALLGVASNALLRAADAPNPAAK